MVITQQKYEAITRVNYRADKKQFTYRQCKNLDIMSKNPSVNSAKVIFLPHLHQLQSKNITEVDMDFWQNLGQ